MQNFHYELFQKIDEPLYQSSIAIFAPLQNAMEIFRSDFSLNTKSSVGPTWVLVQYLTKFVWQFYQNLLVRNQKETQLRDAGRTRGIFPTKFTGKVK